MSNDSLQGIRVAAGPVFVPVLHRLLDKFTGAKTCSRLACTSTCVGKPLDQWLEII